MLVVTVTLLFVLFLKVEVAVAVAVCPPYTTSSGSRCDCLPGFFLDKRSIGMYQDDSLACSPCELGSLCAGGSAVPVASPGYFVADPEEFPTLSRLTVVRCPGGESKCPGRNVCPTGYSGVACNECAYGYGAYATSSSGEVACMKCIAIFGCWLGPSWGVASFIAAGWTAAFIGLAIFIRLKLGKLSSIEKTVGVSMRRVSRRVVPVQGSQVMY